MEAVPEPGSETVIRVSVVGVEASCALAGAVVTGASVSKTSCDSRKSCATFMTELSRAHCTSLPSDFAPSTLHRSSKITSSYRRV
jgi:hypothetical protein